MKFCKSCESYLIEDITTGKLKFNCETCGETFDSEPADTLLITENYGGADNTSKFEVMLNNSAQDPANKKVDIECKKCRMPYMSVVYVGSDSAIHYTCTCGEIINPNK